MEHTTLRKLYEQIGDDVKGKAIYGMVLVLVTEHAPLVIRTLPKKLSDQLLKEAIGGEAEEVEN